MGLNFSGEGEQAFTLPLQADSPVTRSEHGETIVRNIYLVKRLGSGVPSRRLELGAGQSAPLTNAPARNAEG
jgi:hypothetical protein